MEASAALQLVLLLPPLPVLPLPPLPLPLLLPPLLPLLLNGPLLPLLLLHVVTTSPILLLQVGSVCVDMGKMKGCEAYNALCKVHPGHRARGRLCACQQAPMQQPRLLPQLAPTARFMMRPPGTHTAAAPAAVAAP